MKLHCSQPLVEFVFYFAKASLKIFTSEAHQARSLCGFSSYFLHFCYVKLVLHRADRKRTSLAVSCGDKCLLAVWNQPLRVGGLICVKGYFIIHRSSICYAWSLILSVLFIISWIWSVSCALSVWFFLISRCDVIGFFPIFVFGQ